MKASLETALEVTVKRIAMPSLSFSEAFSLNQIIFKYVNTELKTFSSWKNDIHINSIFKRSKTHI